MARRARYPETSMARVHRILLEQLDTAAALLREDLTDVQVHAARQELKRARATLRLLRGALGEVRYRRNDRALRDAARPLTGVRDARMLLDTFRDLLKMTGIPDSSRAGASVLRALRRHRARSDRALQPKDLAASGDLLRAVERRVRRLTTARLETGDVQVGLLRAYRRARKAGVRARSRPDDERLHEWRKQVQYLVNETAVSSADPRPFAAVARHSQKLAKTLGDDHDLALLRAWVEGRRGAAAASRERAQLAVLAVAIQDRRAKFQHRSRRLARRLVSAWRRRPSRT